ncbi:MAG: hypothetical protein OXI88_13615 [Gammaproteobacteria bacterium]|nr:hypothetical protein [Gammaproteobacteria bacterium]MDE0285107.1 hypothetical protein [Gammaproteobacteria bacterium]MDE0512815.1 hypothetical protein [Gammaproteobacteria bacterium]
MTTDTITLAEKLEASGLDAGPAKQIAKAIHEHQSEHFATKSDLAELKVSLMIWNALLAGLIVALVKLI